MKAQLKEKEFSPVTIEITFETAEEMKTWKSLTEYTEITDRFERVGIELSKINDIIPIRSHMEDGKWGSFTSQAEGE